MAELSCKKACEWTTGCCVSLSLVSGPVLHLGQAVCFANVASRPQRMTCVSVTDTGYQARARCCTRCCIRCRRVCPCEYCSVFFLLFTAGQMNAQQTSCTVQTHTHKHCVGTHTKQSSVLHNSTATNTPNTTASTSSITTYNLIAQQLGKVTHVRTAR